MADRHPEEALISHLRGELGAEERLDLDRHLEVCASCRESLEGFRRVLVDLRLSAPEPPAIDWRRYRAELRARIEAREARRWSLPWPRLVPLVATALVAAFALVFTLRGGLRPAPPDDDLPVFDQTAIGGQLDLLQNYPVVENLDLLEDLDVVQSLDGLLPVEQG